MIDKLFNQPVQTRLTLLFGASAQDVTTNIMPDLLDFSYNDKDGGQADEISLSLKDETGKWSAAWRPDGGEVVRAYIRQGTVSKVEKELYCGTFFVDKLSVKGSPRTMELSAVSIPLKTPIRRKKFKRAWEGQKLSQIAEKIASEAELDFFFDSSDDPSFDRQDQNSETNLKFLQRICESAGLSVKVTDCQLVIFSQEEYEAKPPVQKITLGKSSILSWSFEQSQSETYKSVKVSYRDPKQKSAGSAGGYNTQTGFYERRKTDNPAVMRYTYTDETAGKDGQTFELKTRAKSIEEAKRLAKSKLRELNRKAVTGSLELIGDVSLVAGVVIEISGFGSFDGNFYVDSARHSVSGSGYRTSLSIHRCLKDY